MACLNGHVGENDKDWRCIHVRILPPNQKNGKNVFECSKGNKIVSNPQAETSCENKETD